MNTLVDIIIMGDANLCTEKWNDPKFLKKKVANVLKNTLQQCGIRVHDVWKSYMADHVQQNMEISESALDHVYSRPRWSSGLSRHAT